MNWTIMIEPELAGWRWVAREPSSLHTLTGWAYGTRYNAECAARNKIAHEWSSSAAKSAVLCRQERGAHAAPKGANQP
jgi:hypothetical protein